MEQQKLMRDLQTTVLELIADLKDNIFVQEEEIGDLMLVEFFFKKMHPERIMNHIVSKVLPWKEQIKKRDQEFFLQNSSLFQGLPEDRISHYTNTIVKGDRIDDDNRNIVWQYFDTIIQLAETYKKIK